MTADFRKLWGGFDSFYIWSGLGIEFVGFISLLLAPFGLLLKMSSNRKEDTSFRLHKYEIAGWVVMLLCLGILPNSM